MGLTRRRFLTYVGMGTYAALCDPLWSGVPASRAAPARGKAGPGFFDPIRSTLEDALVLPSGYRYDLIRAWGDEIGSLVPPAMAALEGQREAFGFNNDFLAYFPIDGRLGQANSREGLLWVNHEYPDALFVGGYGGVPPKTAEQILAEKHCVGGTVLYVKRDAAGAWSCAHHPQYTRRLTALYPEAHVTGRAGDLVLGDPQDSAKKIKCFGTLANCSGGRTPWLTALSCEEHYTDYNKNHGWSDQQGMGINEELFGWIVEVDPYEPRRPPMKHTALGRFKHENAAMRHDGPGKRLVVYMGDDERDQHLYKFVSHGAYEHPADGVLSASFRESCSELLQRGTLYVANFKHGRWLPLDLYRQESRKKLEATQVAHRGQRVALKSMDLVLLYAREAARALGATRLPRPEDCEIHPSDGSLYVALTKDTKKDAFFGKIVRLIEHDDNPEGERFRFEVFLVGGPESGLACPDNLAFDRRGNLWVACDVTVEKIGQPPYEPFGNNGLFVVPTTGPDAGDAYQFASGPAGSELTGPWFTEDDETLFLAVQHPGEGSTSREQPTSRWPHEREHGPRPAVVAITGFRWS